MEDQQLSKELQTRHGSTVRRTSTSVSQGPVSPLYSEKQAGQAQGEQLAVLVFIHTLKNNGGYVI